MPSGNLRTCIKNMRKILDCGHSSIIEIHKIPLCDLSQAWRRAAAAKYGSITIIQTRGAPELAPAPADRPDLGVSAPAPAPAGAEIFCRS